MPSIIVLDIFFPWTLGDLFMRKLSLLFFTLILGCSGNITETVSRNTHNIFFELNNQRLNFKPPCGYIVLTEEDVAIWTQEAYLQYPLLGTSPFFARKSKWPGILTFFVRKSKRAEALTFFVLETEWKIFLKNRNINVLRHHGSLRYAPETVNCKFPVNMKLEEFLKLSQCIPASTEVEGKEITFYNGHIVSNDFQPTVKPLIIGGRGTDAYAAYQIIRIDVIGKESVDCTAFTLVNGYVLAFNMSNPDETAKSETNVMSLTKNMLKDFFEINQLQKNQETGEQ